VNHISYELQFWNSRLQTAFFISSSCLLSDKILSTQDIAEPLLLNVICLTLYCQIKVQSLYPSPGKIQMSDLEENRTWPTIITGTFGPVGKLLWTIVSSSSRTCLLLKTESFIKGVNLADFSSNHAPIHLSGLLIGSYMFGCWCTCPTKLAWLTPDHVSFRMRCALETTCSFFRIWGVVYEFLEPYYWVLRMSIKCTCTSIKWCSLCSLPVLWLVPYFRGKIWYPDCLAAWIKSPRLPCHPFQVQMLLQIPKGINKRC